MVSLFLYNNSYYYYCTRNMFGTHIIIIHHHGNLRQILLFFPFYRYGTKAQRTLAICLGLQIGNVGDKVQSAFLLVYYIVLQETDSIQYIINFGCIHSVFHYIVFPHYNCVLILTIQTSFQAISSPVPFFSLSEVLFIILHHIFRF